MDMKCPIKNIILMICSKKRKGSSYFCIVSREVEKKTFNNWDKSYSQTKYIL